MNYRILGVLFLFTNMLMNGGDRNEELNKNCAFECGMSKALDMILWYVIL